MSTSRLLSDYASKGPALVERSYDLSEIAAAFEEQTQYRHSVRLGLDEKRKSLLFLARLVPSGLPSERTLLAFANNWAKVLDRVYFFGSIMGYVKDIENTPKSEFLGYWKGRTIFLNLWVHRGAGLLWCAGDVRSLIGTLLHEIMHGFFGVFTRGDCRFSPYDGGLGKDGHGPPWANAMASVQTSLNRVLSFDINGGVFCSVEKSMEIYRRWETRNEMIRWGAKSAEFHYWSSVPEIPRRDIIRPAPIRHYETQQHPIQTTATQNTATQTSNVTQTIATLTVVTQTTATKSTATQYSPPSPRADHTRSCFKTVGAIGMLLIICFVVFILLCHIQKLRDLMEQMAEAASHRFFLDFLEIGSLRAELREL